MTLPTPDALADLDIPEMWHPETDAPAEDGAADTIRGGGCAVWPLPQDETCARTARRRVSRTLRTLGFPDEIVHDTATMVSELATNVVAHALDALPGRFEPTTPELQMYRRGPRPEIVVRVFDTAPWKGPCPGDQLRPDVCSENGRGLEVVNALAREHGGTWGVQRTRSRLAAPVPGKAVYFTVPVPLDRAADGWAPAVPDHLRAVRELETALAARGLGPFHRRDGWDMALLSVRAGITVWIRGTAFSVTSPQTGVVRYPIWDLVAVVEAIVALNEELDADRPRPFS